MIYFIKFNIVGLVFFKIKNSARLPFAYDRNNIYIISNRLITAGKIVSINLFKKQKNFNASINLSTVIKQVKKRKLLSLKERLINNNFQFLNLKKIGTAGVTADVLK